LQACDQWVSLVRGWQFAYIWLTSHFSMSQVWRGVCNTKGAHAQNNVQGNGGWQATPHNLWRHCGHYLVWPKGNQCISLAIDFGGIVAITLFGPKAINEFLLPLTILCDTSLETSTNSEEWMELQHCQEVIMIQRNVCTFGCWIQMHSTHTSFIHRMLQCFNPEGQTTWINYEELEQAMGEKLVVLQNAPSEYATCVL
jgi:hypothetical protein